jgi:predicted enzyme related to lactoylglutathione lyase
VFGWELRPERLGAGHEAAVLASSTAGAAPSAQLVFTDGPQEPKASLGFTVAGLGEASERVERLGGKIEQAGPSVVRCADSQGTCLLLHATSSNEYGRASRETLGVLKVIFVFAQLPDDAALFYKGFAGWDCQAIGRDRDILFVENGPVMGIRAASKSPGEQSGAVSFHISVADPDAILKAIQACGGRAGQPVGAGLFTTRACSDDQGTSFSLWYETACESGT